MRAHQVLSNIRTQHHGRLPTQAPAIQPISIPDSPQLDDSALRFERWLASPLDPNKPGPRPPADVKVRGPVNTDLWIGRSAQTETSRRISNTGATKKLIGHVYCHTSAALMPVESKLEADACVLLDWSPAVRWLRSQPEPIDYHYGWIRSTTPDFHLSIHGLDHFIEIKPLDRAREPFNQARFRCIAAALKSRAASYTILTERSIRHEPRLSNVRFARRFGLVTVTPEDEASLLQCVANEPGISITQIGQQFNDRWSRLQSVLICLIYFRRLNIDWNRAINGGTAVWPVTGGAE